MRSGTHHVLYYQTRNIPFFVPPGTFPALYYETRNTPYFRPGTFHNLYCAPWTLYTLCCEARTTPYLVLGNQKHSTEASEQEEHPDEVEHSGPEHLQRPNVHFHFLFLLPGHNLAVCSWVLQRICASDVCRCRCLSRCCFCCPHSVVCVVDVGDGVGLTVFLPLLLKQADRGDGICVKQARVSYLVGALSPVNHRGLHQGWTGEGKGH